MREPFQEQGNCCAEDDRELNAVHALTVCKRCLVACPQARAQAFGELCVISGLAENRETLEANFFNHFARLL